MTTSKIFILSSSEVKPTLTSFMDPSSFPKKYGGELDWEWGDMPAFDKPTKEIAGVLERIGDMGDKEDSQNSPKTNGDSKNGFLKGPVVFHNDKFEIIGTVDGAERRKTFDVSDKLVDAKDGENQVSQQQPNGNSSDRVDDEKVPEPISNDADKKEGITVTS